jgi:hypothetical protein
MHAVLVHGRYKFCIQHLAAVPGENGLPWDAALDGARCCAAAAGIANGALGPGLIGFMPMSSLLPNAFCSSASAVLDTGWDAAMPAMRWSRAYRTAHAPCIG